MNDNEKLARYALNRGLFKQAKIILAQQSANLPISNSNAYEQLNKVFTPLSHEIFNAISDPNIAKSIKTAIGPDYTQFINFDQEMSWNTAEQALQSLYNVALNSPLVNNSNFKKAFNTFQRAFHSAFSNYMGQMAKSKETSTQEIAKQLKPVRNPDRINKIKQIQEAVGAEPSGVWTPDTNGKFLSFLKNKGWNSYITNNKFVGTLDDAVRAVLVEQAGETRQAERKVRLNKLSSLSKL